MSIQNGIFVAEQIRELWRARAIRAALPLSRGQIQPASLDLRLGAEAFGVQTGFLPESTTVAKKLRSWTLDRFDLRRGGVLEKGKVYLIPLLESLALPRSLRARSNPKSSTGRLDIFTRVVTDRNPRFDDVPAGYRGPLYLEVAPRSFSIRVRTGQSLNQIRFFENDGALSDDELLALNRATPLVFDERGAIAEKKLRLDGEGGFDLRIGLPRKGPAGYRAKSTTKIVDLGRVRAHNPKDFWEPVFAPKGSLIVEPEAFYIFGSKERLVVPPDHSAEMIAYDVGIGELRTNYAGFFDNGFGWNRRPPGTRAILELRAHDVPFLIEDGQVLFRLKYFRTLGTPNFLYGTRRAGSSYQDQDLALAKHFRNAR